MKKMTKRKKYKIISKENIRLKNELDNIKKNSGQSYIRYLEEENKKMLEWVQKIISMEKTFQVENIQPVQIPIYIESGSYQLKDHSKYTREVIVIPEILYSLSRIEKC